jgi:quercetin dioxygenase-like cupin family protein
MIRTVVLFPVLWVAIANSAQGQLIQCSQDSPERRGEPGCTIVADKRLPSPPQSSVFWHIDEFESLAAARQAESLTSVAFAAQGSAWLYTIEADTSNHHGGKHRAVVGPLPIRPNRLYSIMALSTYFLPGQFSVVHTHPGPEAWWVLEGEQCLQTTKATIRARAGEGAIVAEGDTMRLVATGTGPRRALVLVLHDADQPGAVRVDSPPPLQSCQ